MILTAHQPAYLPWLGYFDKIARSDIFVFLDSVQYEKRSFTNRNRIKTASGPIWLTVPVKSKDHFNKELHQIEIDNGSNWKRKHLNSIYVNYKKAPYFEKKYSKLELLYQKEYLLLAELCLDHFLFWLQEFNINNKLIVRSSTLELDDRKSELILSLCQRFKATTYISGALGKNYLDEERFAVSHIEIIYQNYQYTPYQQLWGDFLPNLSVIDYWMNNDEIVFR